MHPIVSSFIVAYNYNVVNSVYDCFQQLIFCICFLLFFNLISMFKVGEYMNTQCLFMYYFVYCILGLYKMCVFNVFDFLVKMV